jgi:hypothetical protein
MSSVFTKGDSDRNYLVASESSGAQGPMPVQLDYITSFAAGVAGDSSYFVSKVTSPYCVCVSGLATIFVFFVQ